MPSISEQRIKELIDFASNIGNKKISEIKGEIDVISEEVSRLNKTRKDIIKEKNKTIYKADIKKQKEQIEFLNNTINNRLKIKQALDRELDKRASVKKIKKELRDIKTESIKKLKTIDNEIYKNIDDILKRYSMDEFTEELVSNYKDQLGLLVAQKETKEEEEKKQKKLLTELIGIQKSVIKADESTQRTELLKEISDIIYRDKLLDKTEVRKLSSKLASLPKKITEKKYQIQASIIKKAWDKSNPLQKIKIYIADKLPVEVKTDLNINEAIRGLKLKDWQNTIIEKLIEREGAGFESIKKAIENLNKVNSFLPKLKENITDESIINMILLEVYNNIDSAGIDSADEIIRKRIEEYILNKNNNSVGKFKKDYKSIIDSKYRISDLKERQKTKNITEKESYDISSKIRDLHKDISEKEVSTGGFEGWKNASDIYRKELDRYNKAKQALKDLKAKGPPVKSATAHVTWITAVQKIENAIKQIQKNLEGLAWDVKTEKSKIEEAQGESKTKDVDKTKEEQGMVESTKKALLAKINKIQDKNKAEELTRKLESVNTNTTLNDYTENIKPILADINNILKIDSGEKATQEKTEKLRDENIKQDIINLANSENVKNAQKVKVYFESKYGTENIESRVSNKEIPEEEYLQYKKAIEAINNIEKRIRLLQESINKK